MQNIPKQAAKIFLSIILFSGILTITSCHRKGCTDPVSKNYDKKANKDDGSCTYPAVGDELGGGKIAYFLVAGDPGFDPNQKHGLIAAKSDQSTGDTWHNTTDTITDATSKELGAGNANTNKIVIVQGDGIYAAKICSDLVLNGFSDWYLPSLNELNKLYINRAAIGGFVDNKGYWSSSESTVNKAWVQFFNTTGSSQINLDKAVSSYVRAVRSF